EKDHPFARYDKKLTELAQAKPFPYATVVVDSLTTYADAMFKEIVRQNPGIQRSKTNLAIGSSVQDYGIFAQYFKHMLTRLLQLPANVIVTGHIVTDKDELTGEIIREPFLPGRQAPKMVPILFEEVYRAFAEIKDGRVAYRAQTQSDGRYKCRSQIRGIPPVIDLSYATLEKFMSA
ncbi:MAG TPA: AAA family ATPase, partial [Pyrinomonadaceae bacterium]|nr:AAA family ATPase [Pyrinomonadaceae bacterium]